MTSITTIEDFVQAFEEGMANGTLFSTKLNYNNMLVQYAKTPDIQNWLRDSLQALLKSNNETLAAMINDIAHDEAKKYENEQTWKQPYAGNRLIGLGWKIADLIRSHPIQ